MSTQNPCPIASLSSGELAEICNGPSQRGVLRALLTCIYRVKKRFSIRNERRSKQLTLETKYALLVRLKLLPEFLWQTRYWIRKISITKCVYISMTLSNSSPIIYCTKGQHEPSDVSERNN